MSSNEILNTPFKDHDFTVSVINPMTNELTSSTMSELCTGYENVVLDFYTTWCKKCPETAKKLDSSYGNLKSKSDSSSKKAIYILINLENDDEGAIDFYEAHNINHCISTCVDDEQDGLGDFGITGIPHKTWIKNGVIMANGSDVGEDTLDFSLDDEETSELTRNNDINSKTGSDSINTILKQSSDEIQNRNEEDKKISKQWQEYEKDEMILKENDNRWVMFPIKHHAVWDMYKKHEASFWTAEEIDLQQDMTDWDNKLNDDEKHFLKHVLAFFAGSDGIVLENLAARFANEVQIPEARAFYGFQMAMENIHSETYSLLIDQYCRNDEDEKKKLFNAISTIPVIQKKALWAASWMGGDLCFAERLVAFAAVEGILFSGSFCAIYWVKKRGLMPGLTFSNELIARDEGLHADFACLLYSMLDKKLPEHHIHKLIQGAVTVEKEFICDALSCDLIGMNKRTMSTYIEFVADRLLMSLGHGKMYNVKNPFEWMEMISLQGKTNFFEKRVGDYQKSGVMASSKTESESIVSKEPATVAVGFSMDEDF